MLAVSPLRSHKDDNRAGGGGGGGDGQNMAVVDEFSMFPDFYDGNLLESIIDFDDIFIDGNVLPDLEVDPELLAEFCPSGGEESGGYCSSVSVERGVDGCNNDALLLREEEEEGKPSSVSVVRGFDECNNDALLLREEGEEGKPSSWSDSNSRRGEEVTINPIVSPKDNENARKSSSSAGHHSKNRSNPQGGKRKIKVDWTPDLHRRFVQAVEQLGVDKAVPSRILEIMGIDCLTRHNIASHLQKYRSHRKHLLAREAEAATWSQRRHLYTSGGNKVRRPDVAAPAANATVTPGPWLAAPATIGFPPPVASPHPVHPHFRPLHVWGHPSVDQSLAYIWPKHLPPHHATSPPRPLPGWVSAVPPQHAPWHPHQRLAGGSLTQGTPCYPQTLQPTRFAVYKVDHRGFGVPMLPGQSASAPPPLDLHPSKETIDAAIGDALTKSWLPLPLGLKPPCLDGVLDELHRQGVPGIPPSSSSSSS